MYFNSNTELNVPLIFKKGIVNRRFMSQNESCKVPGFLRQHSQFFANNQTFTIICTQKILLKSVSLKVRLFTRASRFAPYMHEILLSFLPLSFLL